jgi:hypothetical protein
MLILDRKIPKLSRTNSDKKCKLMKEKTVTNKTDTQCPSGGIHKPVDNHNKGYFILQQY